jgi:hypothetical protein
MAAEDETPADELDVYRAPRTQCAKCGCKLKGDPESNVGASSWCSTCRWLLRMGGVSKPTPAVLETLGLGVPYETRQERERIPNSRKATDWYDPDELDSEGSFDSPVRASVA